MKENPNFILLSIGANLGNRKDNIEKAIRLLAEHSEIRIIKTSSIYETEPVGFKEQPWFLNVVVAAETTLELNRLIQLCKSVEYLLGRIVRKKWTEREIDIDILIYGNNIIETEHLQVPHPRMQERRFVLVPAAEIAAELVHPVYKHTISELLKVCTDSSVVKVFSN